VFNFSSAQGQLSRCLKKIIVEVFQDNSSWLRRIFDFVDQGSHPRRSALKASKDVQLVLHPWMALDALDDDGLLGLIAGADA
jgi:hypothetical protein